MTPELQAAIARLQFSLDGNKTDVSLVNVDDLAALIADHARLAAENAGLIKIFDDQTNKAYCRWCDEQAAREAAAGGEVGGD